MDKLTRRQDEILTVIKKYIAQNGFAPTVREIGNKVGLSSTATVFVHMKHLINKGYISQKDGKFRTLEVLVPNEFIEKDDDIIDVPLLGKVACGNPIEAIEHPNETFSLPSYMVPNNSEVFTLKVDGLSMKNLGIYDGDIVIVKKTNTAKNGDLVVALTDEGGATLKTFYKENGYFRLQPENETMDPIILNNVTILGTAIGLYRKL